eukprot:11317384-Alexandrium_andersonii.AAC.1
MPVSRVSRRGSGALSGAVLVAIVEPWGLGIINARQNALAAVSLSEGWPGSSALQSAHLPERSMAKRRSSRRRTARR